MGSRGWKKTKMQHSESSRMRHYPQLIKELEDRITQSQVIADALVLLQKDEKFKDNNLNSSDFAILYEPNMTAKKLADAYRGGITFDTYYRKTNKIGMDKKKAWKRFDKDLGYNVEEQFAKALKDVQEGRAQKTSNWSLEKAEAKGCEVLSKKRQKPEGILKPKKTGPAQKVSVDL